MDRCDSRLLRIVRVGLHPQLWYQVTAVTEVFLNIPTTAHILGGTIMGANVQEGVIGYRNRVFNYKNMYVCDGSMIGANLGVNPSLSITALSEHAMSYIKSADETDWNERGQNT